MRAHVGICCQTKAICHTKNLCTPKMSEKMCDKILDKHKKYIIFLSYIYLLSYRTWRYYNSFTDRVSVWLLFNAKWAIFQLYHAWWESVTFRWDDDDIRFVLDQRSKLDFSSVSSLYYSASRLVSTHPDFEPTSICQKW